MKNEHEHAVAAVRRALDCGHGRRGTAQHLACLLLDREMPRETAVEAVYMALRRSATRIAIRRLEPAPDLRRSSEKQALVAPWIYTSLEWWR